MMLIEHALASNRIYHDVTRVIAGMKTSGDFAPEAMMDSMATMPVLVYVGTTEDFFLAIDSPIALVRARVVFVCSRGDVIIAMHIGHHFPRVRA